jgi:hypothetical protein
VSNVIGLVAKPTAEDDVRESVIRLLRKTLEEAEAGEVDSLVMIVGCPNGEWSDRASETVKFSEAIGRLEITKQDWIARFMRDRE